MSRIKRLKARIACLLEVQQNQDKEIKVLHELIRALTMTNESLKGRVIEEVIGESDEDD